MTVYSKVACLVIKMIFQNSPSIQLKDNLKMKIYSGSLENIKFLAGDELVHFLEALPTVSV